MKVLFATAGIMNSYLQLLRCHLPGLLENVDLATRQIMWLQQDGTAPHYALIVRAFLNDHYNNRWIRWSGPVARPPCSPDLISPDFYLWGYLKNVVFTQRSTTKQDLMERIHRDSTDIPIATLLDTVYNFERLAIIKHPKRERYGNLR